MKFTIVTPSYNQAEFLENTICSVLNQSYKDFEFIVVDGNSSDDSHLVINKYSSQLSKIIIEHDDGQADAINKGFVSATGDIYSYLNSDDYYFHDTLEKVAKFFLDNPDVDVVYGDCIFVDRDGQFLRYFSEIWDYYPNKLLNNSNFIMQPSTFWRRSAYEKYGPFNQDLHFGFDWAFWCELTSNNCKFYRLHEVLSANRVYDETKTSSGGSERLAELRLINKKYKTTLLDNAYYSFSFAEYAKKTNKSYIDYVRLLYYFIMSYQNIIFHLLHANEKVINGFYSHSKWLKQAVRIKIPFQSEYTKIQIKLCTPDFIGQSVVIGVFGGEKEIYKFESDMLDIELDAMNLNGDIDITMEFSLVYKRPMTLVEEIKAFYQSRHVSAKLLSFIVK